MAHELTKKFGRYEFMYYGQKPWHNLGNEIPERATTTQALTAAGIEWMVGQAPLFAEIGGKMVPVTSHVANYREDDASVLGLVSPDYRVIQNRSAFEMIDTLIGEARGIWETAGSLRGGRQVFACAKLPGDLVVMADDVLQKYLLVFLAHDGSAALRVRFVSTRVVCANTAAVALGERAREITIRHQGEIKDKIAEARRVLGISQKYFEVFGERAQALTSKRVTELMVEGYYKALIPTPEKSDRGEVARVQNLRETLALLFREGRGNQLPSAAGTAWGLFNSVTEYVDHVAPVKQNGDLKATGTYNALFGPGDTLKQQAWDLAVAI